MTTTTTFTMPTDRHEPRSGGGEPRQLAPPALAAVWAAAAAPMALASWVVAPRLARSLGTAGLPKALLVCLTVGLLWQFVLTIGLVGAEQRTLRWRSLRHALWLRAPVAPTSGRRGGRTWFVLVPFAVVFALEVLVPSVRPPVGRDLGRILSSTEGQAFFHHAWGWFALCLVMFVANTVVGEELLFRGYLLPRMKGLFGRRAWLANGALFALYHLHVPWAIPGAFLDSVALAYPTQRYWSALMGIVVHSFQSVFFTLGLLVAVLR